MINVQSTFLRHKVLLTMATIFTMMLMWAGGASAEWPEEGIGEDFWYDILKIWEEEPSFELDLGGPTAVALPFVEEPTEVRWMTEGDASVYVYTDHWQRQESHGAITYEGEAIVAFLPSATTGAFAYVGTEYFDVPCGGVEARLSGSGKVTTSGRSTSRTLAVSEAKTLAEGRASTDANLAVTGYNCPETCKISTRGIWWSNITDSGSSYAFFNSDFGLGASLYEGWAKYEWSAYVICKKPSPPNESPI